MTAILIDRNASNSVELGPAWGSATHEALFGNGRRQDMIETRGSLLGRQILHGAPGGIFGGKR